MSLSRGSTMKPPGDQNTGNILDRLQVVEYRVDSPETVQKKKPKLDQKDVQITELDLLEESRSCQLGLQDSAADRNSSGLKERRARTRAALAEHFLPIWQNPTFLDIISEESCSDSDQQGDSRKKKKRSQESDVQVTRNGFVAPGSKPEVVYVDSSDSDDEFLLINQLTPPPTPDDSCFPPVDPLKTLCIRTLMTLPFGPDVLQELADVSETIRKQTPIHQPENFQELTRKLAQVKETLKSMEPEVSATPRKRSLQETATEEDVLETQQMIEEPLVTDTRNVQEAIETIAYRRFSLPEEIFERQLSEIREKERKLQEEIEELEAEKRKILLAKNSDSPIYNTTKQTDVDSSLRFRMFEEFMDKVAAIRERKSKRIIKLTNSQRLPDSRRSCQIDLSGEFLSKAQERIKKFGPAEEEQEQQQVAPLDDILDNRLFFDLKDCQVLPKHLREFVEISEESCGEEVEGTMGVWSPGQKLPETKPIDYETKTQPIPPVWTPRSAGSSPTRQFKPVSFDSPILERKNKETGGSHQDQWGNRLQTSLSAPDSGFTEYSSVRLPKVQNPTVTLLQKAREGQLPKATSYLQDTPKPFRHPDNLPIRKQEILPQTELVSGDEFAFRMEEGIGPIGNDGMPLGLRSDVKEANQSKWYKKMYDTIHKQKPDREYVTVRYKQRRARPYVSGYFSEPEQAPGNFSAYYYDSDNEHKTLDRRRHPNNMSSTLPTRPKETCKFPGRIENYVPGRSSISETEAKEWWDEVMDIFDGHLDQQKSHSQPHPKSFINQALKESGYESDSTLIFKRREEAAQQLSPNEQKEAYKTIQKGGDVPLQGLRKPAPERPKVSPRKYVENEVTIHYKSPVRHEIKDAISEEELSQRQAEHMRRVYEEERRRKYLQELQDMHNRRHTDNFVPSEKSPISLTRYDDYPIEEPPRLQQRPKSPEPRLIARALYNFVGQSARELTFRKGEIIYVRRQVDKNWYEGDHNATIGLFPSNYVEIVPFAGGKSSPRKPYEGQARAKFNFIAQTNLELSLAKGELVVIIRKVDHNWYEGRVGDRKGIFPVSYVEVLIDPASNPPANNKPISSPAAHSLLLNGSAGGKESMGSHGYLPPGGYSGKMARSNGGGIDTGRSPTNQTLHIDTRTEPVPYRALYKYHPQNEDELELLEGDTVYVLEKCDDGWYVGSSQRTGAFGTFPGNYVDLL